MKGHYRKFDQTDLATDSSTLRYRNWNKDYFTSLSPSFQGADYLSDNIEMSYVLELHDNSSNLKGHDFLPRTSSDLTWSGESVPASSHIGSLSRPDASGLVFNVANLRAAYALDKLYRISIAAGDGDYGSQIKAHYGFDAVHDDWKSQFLVMLRCLVMLWCMVMLGCRQNYLIQKVGLLVEITVEK